MLIRQIYDPVLSQYAYLIGCQKTKEAILIDPQRDLERYLSIAHEEGVQITHVTETHIHADFLSGSRQAAHQYGMKALLSGEGGDDWNYLWVDDEGIDVDTINDGDEFKIGNIHFKVIHTPGHTPEHIAFLVTDVGGGANEAIALVSGDFVFVGALGRPDLLEVAAGITGSRIESAKQLYASAKKVMEYPEYLQIWPGHGAGSACGKSLSAIPLSTMGYEKKFNSSLLSAAGDIDNFTNFILDGQSDPPLYFGLMKKANREGPALIEEAKFPNKISAAAFCELSLTPDVEVIDTRKNRLDFVDGHLQGSIYAPVNTAFAGLAGSYIEQGKKIALIVDESQLDDAVLTLQRIGLDQVVAYIESSDLFDSDDFLKHNQALAKTTFKDLNHHNPDLILDVRNWHEYQSQHAPGAKNIAHTRLDDHLSELPKDKKIAVHCLSGARACAASAFLQSKGFDIVYIDDKFSNHVEI